MVSERFRSLVFNARALYSWLNNNYNLVLIRPSSFYLLRPNLGDWFDNRTLTGILIVQQKSAMLVLVVFSTPVQICSKSVTFKYPPTNWTHHNNVELQAALKFGRLLSYILFKNSFQLWKVEVYKSFSQTLINKLVDLGCLRLQL